MSRLKKGIKLSCLICRGDNVIAKGYNRAKHRVYFCKDCHRSFSETYNTSMYRTRIPKDVVEEIAKLIRKQENTFRVITETTGYRKETVINLIKKLAEYDKRLQKEINPIKYRPFRFRGSPKDYYIRESLEHRDNRKDERRLRSSRES